MTTVNTKVRGFATLLQYSVVTVVLASVCSTRVVAQDEPEKRKAGLDLYGFIMVDAIFDNTGIKADWLGAARPTQLPSVEDEFGVPGQQ